MPVAPHHNLPLHLQHMKSIVYHIEMTPTREPKAQRVLSHAYAMCLPLSYSDRLPAQQLRSMAWWGPLPAWLQPSAPSLQSTCRSNASGVSTKTHMGTSQIWVPQALGPSFEEEGLGHPNFGCPILRHPHIMDTLAMMHHWSTCLEIRRRYETRAG